MAPTRRGRRSGGGRGAREADGAAGEVDEVVAVADEREDAGEEAAFGGRIAVHDRPRGGRRLDASGWVGRLRRFSRG